ncbi:MAG: hypothetical protein ACOC8B_02545 [Gemmatimonadota bacterium]
MKKLELAALFSAVAIVMGGGGLMAAPTTTQPLDCNETQIDYVKDAIREECGDWGGRALVTCDGWDVDVHSIECNA